MASKMMWTVAICVLLLTLSPLGTSMPVRNCTEPYLLKNSDHHHEHEGVEVQDLSDQFYCPEPYKLYEDECFGVVEKGSYRNIVEMDFLTAGEHCSKAGANVISVNDLDSPHVQLATLHVLQQYQGFREVFVFNENTCLEMSGSLEWDRQFCVKPCQKKKNKVILCRCPALPKP